MNRREFGLGSLIVVCLLMAITIYLIFHRARVDQDYEYGAPSRLPAPGYYMERER
jgi:hypothetical protein